MSFADPTLLKGTVEFETQVLGATATIQRQAGTPISNTNALDITVRNVNGKGYVDVCANGSYVNGHLLAVSVMALVEV